MSSSRGGCVSGGLSLGLKVCLIYKYLPAGKVCRNNLSDLALELSTILTRLDSVFAFLSE